MSLLLHMRYSDHFAPGKSGDPQLFVACSSSKPYLRSRMSKIACLLAYLLKKNFYINVAVCLPFSQTVKRW